MPTTFSTQFRTEQLQSLIGQSAATSLAYVNFYAGSQVAAPDATVLTANLVYTTATNSVNVAGQFSAPAGGTIQVANRVGTNNANNAVTITTARICNSAGQGLIDTPATLAGGGGGVIVPSLLSSTGSPMTVGLFTVNLPLSSGTFMYNAALRDALLNGLRANANVAALTSATITIYSGTAPANADLAPTGTVLWSAGTSASGTGTWNSVVSGSASLVSAISAVASNSGTVGYLRIVKGSYVMQASVGTSGTNFIVSSATMTAGTTYSITEATITA